MKKQFTEIMVALCNSCYDLARQQYGSKFTIDLLIESYGVRVIDLPPKASCANWECKAIPYAIVGFKRGRTLVFPQKKDTQIHPGFTQMSAGAGMSSCTNPPMQQIPSRGRTTMDTKKLTQITKDAIQAKISADEEFTAYDITKTLRQANPGEEVDHTLVRAIVMEEFRSGNMVGVRRESKDFQGKMALVYTKSPAQTDDADDDAEDDTDDAGLDAAKAAVKAVCGD